MERKASLRRDALQQLAAMNQSAIQAACHTMTARLLAVPELALARRVHIYTDYPAWHEIPTQPMIEQLHRRFPAMTIETSPTQTTAPFPVTQFDVIVLPCLLVDRHGHRLGRGAGWYDQFLAQQHGAQRICAAYDWQLVERVPAEPHDVPVTMILTEQRIMRPTARA